MKRLYTMLSLFLIALSVYSQNNVFVLVDVSKSITQNDLNNAKQALTEVLSGSSLSRAFISQGNQADLINFKLVQGDKLAITRFGSLQTTLAINPSLSQIQNTNTDVSEIINSIAWTPTDQQTYITLAKAKVAEYAKNHNITEYKLYIISDNINDDYGQGGKPIYPDDYTKNLAEGYNSSTNPVSEGGYTKLKFASNSFFTLSFSPKVDVSKYTLPVGNTNPTPSPPTNQYPEIKITSFADGRKDDPKPTNSNSFPISWTCNCPTGTTFNVALTEVDGGKFKDQSKKNIQGYSVKYTDVPSGIFKIVVTTSNGNSAYTYIETSSSSYSWLILILILIVAGAVGYYFWNKKREEKIETFATNKADDIFSKGSGGAATGNSSNSDYF